MLCWHSEYGSVKQVKRRGGEKSLLFSLGGKNTAKILAKIPYFNGYCFHHYFLATR